MRVRTPSAIDSRGCRRSSRERRAGMYTRPRQLDRAVRARRRRPSLLDGSPRSSLPWHDRRRPSRARRTPRAVPPGTGRKSDSTRSLGPVADASTSSRHGCRQGRRISRRTSFHGRGRCQGRFWSRRHRSLSFSFRKNRTRTRRGACRVCVSFSGSSTKSGNDRSATRWLAASLESQAPSCTGPAHRRRRASSTSRSSPGGRCLEVDVVEHGFDQGLRQPWITSLESSVVGAARRRGWDLIGRSRCAEDLEVPPYDHGHGAAFGSQERRRPSRAPMPDGTAGRASRTWSPALEDPS